MRLTQSSVDHHQPPKGKRAHIEWDDDLPCFGLQILGTARKFVVETRIGYRREVVTLARTDKIRLETARHVAEQIFDLCEFANKRLRKLAMQNAQPEVEDEPTDWGARRRDFKPTRMLRFAELSSVHGITYSRRHLRRMEDEGRFPNRVNVGPRMVRWVEDEIEEFLSKKIEDRDAGNHPRLRGQYRS